jgi:DNA-binding NtrC family response regulator
MARILIVDDEDRYLELCRRFMPEHEFLPPARSFREASAALRGQRGRVDLVLLDVHFEIPAADLLPYDKPEELDQRGLERLRRAQGLYILDQLRQAWPDLPVIVMTARDDLPIEADAERLRAQDYTYLLDDEYLDARSLKLQIETILASAARPGAAEDGPFFWGRSAEMQALRRRLQILARGSLPMILQGATGTGKSLLAREFIHVHSGRRGAFVAVDLSTISSELMGAHLFGVVRGAFTGAVAAREGVLAKAHLGTLFLDEIGNLSLDLQKQLLLVLQDGTYRPVGSVDERSVDVKLVVATNEDLPELVRRGRFREDLYMRLNPSTAVTLPSLHDRRDDLDHLLGWFIQQAAREPYNRDLVAQYAAQRGMKVALAEAAPVTIGTRIPERLDARRLHFLLHPSSAQLLRECPWPGNFRQLAMVLSNLVTFALVELVEQAERVEPDDPALASRPDVVPVPPRTVRELLRPMASKGDTSRVVPAEAEPAARSEGNRVAVEVRPASTLNAVSCEVERQYFEALYQQTGGDLRRMGQLLLDDDDAARKIQLRMNQLGLSLRDLRRRHPR